MTNNWFDFAREDLIVAKASFKEKVYNQVCFHCQQGTEKMLKGFLKSKKQNLPKTHFLEELIELCSNINHQFKSLKSRCSILDRYYILTRYPDAIPGMLSEGLPEKKDAEEALETLRKIMDFVEKKLKELK
ncbi:MAG: DNA-binding protein [bacterium (Candidatus Ratteibacteria) CG_4_10_14_3_um_filter_41_18]|uniref:DNA-binding protein n=1 Tax=bacterium (Candidatus Ratteibacteria) CG_4_10_14_3_um_filter_41_18 TaxID=2014287 RepID=A0A2M7M432_9BACT|nr:MAG: DNA-binding protein [bacterium (Candidatus Ratteibacteria) CG_4_10_14_3_um_filter_41_18]